MLTNRPRAPRPPPPSRLPRPVTNKKPSLDAIWRSQWPIEASSTIAALMLLFVAAIIGLEIAHLANGTDSEIYGDTAATGAGFWCGFFIILAAIFILIINRARRTKMWTSIALAFTIIAGLFSIVLIILDGIALGGGKEGVDKRQKRKLVGAQLGLAIAELLLCIAYIITHTIIAFRIRKMLR